MKKKIKSILFLLLFLLTWYAGMAQQDALFSQYMFNKLLVNPGYAGSKEVLAIDILDRYQWVGIDGAPRTFTLAAHTSLRNRKIGLGVHIYRDRIGPIDNKGLMGNYAYRIFFKNSVLSFGLQFGVKFFDIDWLESYNNVTDPAFNFRYIQRWAPDANLGVYYYAPKYYIGFSSKQLFQNEYGQTLINGQTTYTRLTRHFYGLAGMAFEISDLVAFRPSLLVKYVSGAPIQMDLNMSAVFADQFWVGLTWRTEKAVIFLTEVRLTPRIRVGYSFDFYFNEIATQNKGTHEVRLGFDFELFQSRMLTPRYFF